jgi:hypothetical protein
MILLSFYEGEVDHDMVAAIASVRLSKWAYGTHEEHRHSKTRSASYLGAVGEVLEHVRARIRFQKNRLFVSACHTGLLADNRTPVGSASIIYTSFKYY